jgi:hypothetical protein
VEKVIAWGEKLNPGLVVILVVRSPASMKTDSTQTQHNQLTNCKKKTEQGDKHILS